MGSRLTAWARWQQTSKYRSIRTTLDGRTFDSQLEAHRYAELKILEKTGTICDLTCQYPFALTVNGHKIGVYRADFRYRHIASGQYINEDAKGFDTALSRWKRRHVLLEYGETISLVKRT
jgi:hypothetical protein